MFRKLTHLALLCSLLVLTGALAAQAAPIVYSSTDYEAYASASDAATPEEIEDLQSGSSLSIAASATVDNASATAGASDDTQLQLSAFSSASTAPENTAGQASSSLAASLIFTATFPQISISYTYNIQMTVEPGDEGSASAEVGLSSILINKTTSETIWSYDRYYYNYDGVYYSFDLEGNQVAVTEEEVNGLETVNYLTTLTKDEEYELYFNVSALYIYVSYDGEASSEISLTNINIQAVPLPPSLFLVGAGLLGLWGLRRRPPH
jgi:hypothetical protein